MNNISGSIPYEIIFDSENGTEIKYTSTIENDMAGLAIAVKLLELQLEDVKEIKNEQKGRIKRQLGHHVHDLSKTTQQVRGLLETLFDTYSAYKKLHPDPVAPPNIESITNL